MKLPHFFPPRGLREDQIARELEVSLDSSSDEGQKRKAADSGKKHDNLMDHAPIE
jgi:hypothetical protein